MDHFATFWPKTGKNQATFPKGPAIKTFHPEGWREKPTNTPSTPGSSELLAATTTTTVHSQQQKDGAGCPYEQQWRQILVCQPPIKALALVQEVDVRGSGVF